MGDLILLYNFSEDRTDVMDFNGISEGHQNKIILNIFITNFLKSTLQEKSVQLYGSKKKEKHTHII